ncbi:Protein NAS-28, partial [Aphelenchoides avenae]
ALEKNEAQEASNETGIRTIETANKPIADLLLEGDLLLTEDQAKSYGVISGGRQKRNAVPEEYAKWPVDQPIPYFFDASIDEASRKLIRQGLQWWTDNSCLTWKEDAPGKPKVKIFKGQGCYTYPGRLANADEHPLSLGEDCMTFRTITHESAHAMGLFHEMSRQDRDNYIQIIWEKVPKGYEGQYDIFDKSLPYGTVYDYGSNMHYGGFGDYGVVQVLAKEKGFQHTMGNEYGPSFQD